MNAFESLPFKEWIDSHRSQLQPPVGNKVIWPNRDFIVMVVGGPNERTDFHVNEGEEFFHQLEGNMVLKVLEAGRIRDIPIRQGEIYLLPPRVPHSPQREARSVGLVIEQRRRPGQKDGLQWYCERCTTKLYEEWFELVDIEKQFQGVFQRYYDSPHTRCPSCQHTNGRKWHAEN